MVKKNNPRLNLDLVNASILVWKNPQVPGFGLLCLASIWDLFHLTFPSLIPWVRSENIKWHECSPKNKTKTKTPTGGVHFFFHNSLVTTALSQEIRDLDSLSSQHIGLDSHRRTWAYNTYLPLLEQFLLPLDYSREGGYHLPLCSRVTMGCCGL